ncbi:hypothetical protein [Parapedobacter pyrenivorans]
MADNDIRIRTLGVANSAITKAGSDVPTSGLQPKKEGDKTMPSPAAGGQE